MFIALLSLHAAAAEPILEAITLHNPERQMLRRHDLREPLLFLELDDGLPGAAFWVDHDQERADAVTVALRYETTISVSMDGSHTELHDFVHHTSEWLPASDLLPTLTSDDRRRFPAVTPEQLSGAISAAMAADQQSCASPWSAPCRVGVSTIWLKVSALQDGEEVESRTIKAIVPMGC